MTRMVEMARAVVPVLARGGRELVGMARRGEITREMYWVAANGAKKFVEAIAGGDVCTGAELKARRAACRACDGRRAVEGLVLGTCGELFRPSAVVGKETCGCVCDGKVMVGSESCPRGAWVGVALTVSARG